MNSTAGAQKKIELVCTTLQMAILMFINEVESEGATVKQIMDVLNIDEDSAKKNIQTLSGSKMKILRISTAKDEIESSQESMLIDSNSQPTEQKVMVHRSITNDIVMVNYDFKSNLNHLSLPAPVMEEVAKKEKIEGNRKMAIDSVVVRVMKSRKKLTF